MEGWRDYIRDTEKPNLSGCSLNRRFRIVDLPVPDGPDITMGGSCWIVDEDIVRVLMLWMILQR